MKVVAEASEQNFEAELAKMLNNWKLENSDNHRRYKKARQQASGRDIRLHAHALIRFQRGSYRD